MGEAAGSFDPNAMPDDGFSQTTALPDCLVLPGSGGGDGVSGNDVQENIQLSNLTMEELMACHDNATQQAASATAGVVAADMERHHNLMQEAAVHGSNQTQLSYDHCNWDAAAAAAAEMSHLGFNHQQQQQHQDQLFRDVHDFTSSLPREDDENNNDSNNNQFGPTPELLNFFHMPRCPTSSLLPNINSSISFATADAGSASTVLYNPLFHLNLPLQPPLFKELLQSLPNGHGGLVGAPAMGTGLAYGGMLDEGDASGGLYSTPDHGDGDLDIGGQFENGVLEFSRDISYNMGKGRDGKKGTKHFATEKQRREQLNDKYGALRNLVPNPTKNDRASVVGDAIEYIKELLRTMNELKILVEKKRCGRERRKRHKTEGSVVNGDVDVESCNNVKPGVVDPAGEQTSYNGGGGPSPLRSSWLQRKSKETEIDVRIVEDEVTIKLVQRKKINCLLYVSRILDELQLDLHHVAGGHIGDHYSFLFNTKIYEGSCVYASAIANKLIQVVDRQV